MNRPRFITAAEVQRLSAQAESFLNRVLELIACYPTVLNEHGHAPADPAQLRNHCYPHKPEIRYTHVARWLAELESASIVTVYETTGHGRWLMFALREVSPQRSHKPPAPILPARMPLLPLSNSDADGRVIHISGDLSPPDPAEIAAVAAAASDSLDLIARLTPHFPRHNVSIEFGDFFEHRKKIGRPATPETFAKWMLGAQVRLKKPKAAATQPRKLEDGRSKLGDDETSAKLAEQPLLLDVPLPKLSDAVKMRMRGSG